jgi:hypothetical protein
MGFDLLRALDKRKPDIREANYGWYWWADRSSGWVGHTANGWKGRITVVPDRASSLP